MEGGKGEQPHSYEVRTNVPRPQLPSQTDIVPNFYAKKDQWAFEGRKRHPFIFHFGCPWSGDSTGLWGRGR